MTKKFGFDNASDVVISGCSAGALRVFAHLDALRSFVPSGARVVGWGKNHSNFDEIPIGPLPKVCWTFCC